MAQQYKLVELDLTATEHEDEFFNLMQTYRPNDQYLIWQQKSKGYVKLLFIGRPNAENVEDTFFFQSILKFQIPIKDILNDRPKNKRRIRTIRGCLNAFFYSEDKVPSTLVLRPNNDSIMQTRLLLGKTCENMNQRIFHFINKTFFKIETDEAGLGNEKIFLEKIEALESRILKLESLEIGQIELKSQIQKLESLEIGQIELKSQIQKLEKFYNAKPKVLNKLKELEPKVSNQKNNAEIFIKNIKRQGELELPASQFRNFITEDLVSLFIITEKEKPSLTIKDFLTMNSNESYSFFKLTNFNVSYTNLKRDKLLYSKVDLPQSIKKGIVVYKEKKINK
jgi:hypothetical protein